MAHHCFTSCVLCGAPVNLDMHGLGTGDICHACEQIATLPYTPVPSREDTRLYVVCWLTMVVATTAILADVAFAAAGHWWPAGAMFALGVMLVALVVTAKVEE